MQRISNTKISFSDVRLISERRQMGKSNRLIYVFGIGCLGNRGLIDLRYGNGKNRRSSA